MTMPASQPVDYVAMLDMVADYWSPESRVGANLRSLAAQITALREAVKGCGDALHPYLNCGDVNPSGQVRFCKTCAPKYTGIVRQLTHTNPRDAHA